MGKAKVDLPSADMAVPNGLPQTAFVSCPVETEKDISLSRGEFSETTGYVSRHIDVKMSREQAVKFKSLLRKLEDENKQLKDGTPVNNKRRAVLWLIENA